MSRKKTSALMFEKIERALETESPYLALEKLAVKISLKDMTQEERIQEASKPLYLRRYE